MIPKLNEHGYLPPGVQVATIDELIARFGVGSDQREVQAQSLRWLMDLCAAAKIRRLLVNGSFVTDRPEPNDVDCVLLAPLDYSEDSPEVQALLAGLPFIEMKIVAQTEYDFFASSIYASDRMMTPKGVVEIQL